MSIKSRDKVIDLASGSAAVVITTHTYPEGEKVASIKLNDNGNKWVLVSQLKKV